MAGVGFYLMHRGWQDHAVFRNETFSRRDAFVWLIEEAAFASRQVHAPKGIITLSRGQICHSTRYMAKAWGWDDSRVRRFLSSLLAAEIIDAATDAGQYVVTICNYDVYQALESKSDAATAAATPQQRRGGDAKKNECNEGNEVKKTPSGVLRAHEIPKDWVPFDGTGKMADIAKFWSSDFRETQIERFKAHHRARGNKMKDWDSAWQTWIGNSIRFAPPSLRDDGFPEGHSGIGI